MKKIKYVVATYKNIDIIKIIPPVRSYFSLSSDVPDIELEPIGLNTFNIKTLKRLKLRKFDMDSKIIQVKNVRSSYSTHFRPPSEIQILALGIGSKK